MGAAHLPPLQKDGHCSNHNKTTLLHPVPCLLSRAVGSRPLDAMKYFDFPFEKVKPGTFSCWGWALLLSLLSKDTESASLVGGKKSPGAQKCGQSGSFCAWRKRVEGRHLLIPSFFRAEIPMNTRNVRLGSAFLPAVQPSLRTPNNSQPLVLLDSLETPGCNGCNYELMALNPPSDLMPSSPVWFLFPFCLLTAVPQPQLFVISH